MPLKRIIDVAVDKKIEKSSLFISRLQEHLINDGVNFYYYKYTGKHIFKIHDHLENYSQLVYAHKCDFPSIMNLSTGVFVFNSVIAETKFLLESEMLPNDIILAEMNNRQIRIRKYTSNTLHSPTKNLFKFKSAVLKTYLN